eukprot:36150-Rhodomonas_salina.10
MSGWRPGLGLSSTTVCDAQVGANLPNFLQAEVENSFVTFNGTRAFVMDVIQVRGCPASVLDAALDIGSLMVPSADDDDGDDGNDRASLHRSRSPGPDSERAWPQISETTMRFMLVAPFLDAAGTATVLIRVNGSPIPTRNPILYTYRSEYIQSITPASGLVSGGQQVTCRPAHALFWPRNAVQAMMLETAR